MKRILILSFLFLIFAFTFANANKFDLNSLSNLKKGLSKKQVCKLLEQDSIKYEIKNNSKSGKYICIKPQTKLVYDFDANEIKLAFEKNKLTGIVFMLNDRASNYDLKMDKICNCKYDGGEYYLYSFDNGCLAYYPEENDQLLFMINMKHKCEE